MYVDNHQVYSCGERIKEDVERILNNEGMCISEWYQDNLLKCNHNKFQVMSLRPRNKKEININMISVNIDSTPKLKLLGVTIDDSLEFTNHIKDMCSKGAKKVGVLMRFKNLGTVNK